MTISSKRRLEAAAYAGMFVFGMVMALLGAILPLIATRLKIDLARAGSLFGALSGSMLVSGFGVGPVMDRYGKKIPMIAGPLLTAAAVFLLAEAGTYETLMGAVLLLGFGGGFINNVTNALVSDLYDDPRRKGAALNLLGTMFGVGALALPFAIGRLLASVGLEAILYGAAAVSGAAGLFAAVHRYPAPAQGEAFSGREAVRLLRDRDVLALGGSLFLQSGNEFVLSGFIATFLTTVIGLAVGVASYVLALYWTVILIGRFVVSRVLLRVRAPNVLIAGALGSACGVGLLALARSPAMAVAGIVVLGLSISSIFPTTLGVAGSRFQSYVGTVFGILFAVSLTGGMLVPAVFGPLAQAEGLRTALVIPIAAFCGMAAIHAFYTRPTETRLAVHPHRRCT